VPVFPTVNRLANPGAGASVQPKGYPGGRTVKPVNIGTRSHWRERDMCQEIFSQERFERHRARGIQPVRGLIGRDRICHAKHLTAQRVSQEVFRGRAGQLNHRFGRSRLGGVSVSRYHGTHYQNGQKA
jgi:hypothetical protein